MDSFAELSLTSFLADRLQQAGFLRRPPFKRPLFRWQWRGAICWPRPKQGAGKRWHFSFP